MWEWTQRMFLDNQAWSWKRVVTEIGRGQGSCDCESRVGLRVENDNLK